MSLQRQPPLKNMQSNRQDQPIRCIVLIVVFAMILVMVMVMVLVLMNVHAHGFGHDHDHDLLHALVHGLLMVMVMV